MAERARREILSLPMFRELTEEPIDRVADAVASFQDGPTWRAPGDAARPRPAP